MLVDLATFSEEEFDPKAWVNTTCASRPPDDSLDKYLSELEMQLQLTAEDLAASLEELSTNALLRVPRAVRETNRVKDDAISLRGTVGGIMNRLEQAEGSSAQSVAALARVDVVKQHMEDARDTLQDAAGLAQLSASVEEVFASGDLPRVAETLASMRKCLAVVGEVPEFADVKRQLAVLEDRLEQMVQPRLSETLSQRKVDATQKLRDILLAIGRYKSLEQLYTRVQVRPLRRMWDKFDAAEKDLPIGASAGRLHFVEWLPSFYDEVLLTLDQEVRWCQVAFPDEHATLIPHLIVEAMSAIASSFSSRVEAASQEASSGASAGLHTAGVETTGSHAPSLSRHMSRLGTLIALHTTTGTFSRNVQMLLLQAGSATDNAVQVVRAIHAPFESYKLRYGELERSQLQTEISVLDLRPATPRDLGSRGTELAETVKRVEVSVPEVMQTLEAAMERCLALTGGSEVEALLRTLDDTLLQYLAQLLTILRSLRVLCGIDSEQSSRGANPQIGGTKADSSAASARENGESPAEGSEDPDDLGDEQGLGFGGGVESGVEGGEEWALVEGALKLLTVAESISSQAAVLEASLRTALARLATRLMPAVKPTGAGENSDGVGPAGASRIGIQASSPLKDILQEVSISDAPANTSSPRAVAPFPGGTHGSAGGAQVAALDVEVLRLLSLPEKAARLSSLLEQARDARFRALPRSVQRVQALHEAVSDLVYDVLVQKVRACLADVARMPDWTASEEDNAFGLPVFSAYPLPYITAVGEYLLTLPQQLEPLSAGESGTGASGQGAEEGGEDEGQGSYLATEWMFKVAEGAAGLYEEQLRAIPALSERGVQQLAADIGYLGNMLSYFGITLPPALATFQACLAVPPGELAALIAEEAGTNGSLDATTARLVAKMRQVVLE